MSGSWGTVFECSADDVGHSGDDFRWLLGPAQRPVAILANFEHENVVRWKMFVHRWAGKGDPVVFT